MPPNSKQISQPNDKKQPTPGTSEIGKNRIKNVLFPPFSPRIQNPKVKIKNPGVKDDATYDLIFILFFFRVFNSSKF